MKTKVESFEFADFQILQVQTHQPCTSSPERDVLEEFVRRGLFTVVRQERTPTGTKSYERTAEGRQVATELTVKFEELFNKEMVQIYERQLIQNTNAILKRENL